ncbi:MAG: hypothetical protein V3W31_02100 [Thermodesulfobacteriota bacterium]
MLKLSILPKATETEPFSILPGKLQPDVLDKKEFVSFLPIYKPEHIYIAKAEFANTCLTATFKTFEYPYSRIRIKHFTREHAIMFITQAAYVLAGELAKHGRLDGIDVKRYRRLIATEQATFSRVTLNFKKVIRNRDGISLRIWCAKSKKVGAKVLVKMLFEFEEGECYGACDGLIATDSSFFTANF